MELETIKKDLINRALEKYTAIYCCRDEMSLGDCFTMRENMLYFRFSTEDDDTHMLSCELQADN